MNLFVALIQSVCVAFLCAAQAHAQRSDAELNLLPVQGNVYMMHGGREGNLAVQIGIDGIMVVNAMRRGMAEAIAAKLTELTPKPIRYIINTGPGLHNTGGNAELAALGMFGATPDLAPGQTAGATIVAHENLMIRLSDASRQQRNPYPVSGVPKDAYYLAFKDIYFNGEPVFVYHAPNAHSDGDSIVLFRRSDVIAVGDLFTVGEYPVIDIEKGGSVRGLIRALNRVLDLAVPERLQDGGTRIIPGRGRLCNEADVVEYRNMIAIVTDRILDMIDGGMTLAEVQDAAPTRDYDLEYGPGAEFIEAVYHSLTAAGAESSQ